MSFPQGPNPDEFLPPKPDKQAEGRTACPNCGWLFKSYGTFGGIWCGRCRQSGACPHPAEIHGYILKRDGVKTSQHWCMTCGHRHDSGKGVKPGPVCFVNHLAGNSTPCARCGSRDGTQTHHWAPHAIFDDSWDWPTSELCPGCHRLWHDTMRKAKGYSRKEAG